MVWIIPKDTDEKMIKQLICLMANIESGCHIFDENCALIEEGGQKYGKPFNVYDCNYIADEYRFVKGYIRNTGVVTSNQTIEGHMHAFDKLMPHDIPLDVSYCYPTAHYTVARTQISKEYTRLIMYEHQKVKNIKHKYHFVWVNESFELKDFQELQNKLFPETYVLMRSLSTIIYDNAGIFAKDHMSNVLVAGNPVQNINYPEIWQIRGSERIVNIPIIISSKFGIRSDIAKKFSHLIPDLKKFSVNRSCMFDYVPYYAENDLINITEEKTIQELNLVEFDKKEPIFTKLEKTKVYKLGRSDTKLLTLDIILNYMLCHVCCTPLYDKFYYIILNDHKPTAHIPICAMCIHNASVAKKLTKTLINVGICKSHFSASEVTSMIPKPTNVTYENYEKYKQLMSLLLNQTLEFNENTAPILYESDTVMLVNELTTDVIKQSLKKPNTAIFIVKIIAS